MEGRGDLLVADGFTIHGDELYARTLTQEAGGGVLGGSVVGQTRANRSDTLPGFVVAQSTTVRSMARRPKSSC